MLVWDKTKSVGAKFVAAAMPDEAELNDVLEERVVINGLCF